MLQSDLKNTVAEFGAAKAAGWTAQPAVVKRKSFNAREVFGFANRPLLR